ncbi:MAG: hypothetical protein Q4A16_00235 [Lautropia sp.]|nr:hypothetical protein [Lautropia sp.]
MTVRHPLLSIPLAMGLFLAGCQSPGHIDPETSDTTDTTAQARIATQTRDDAQNKNDDSQRQGKRADPSGDTGPAVSPSARQGGTAKHEPVPPIAAGMDLCRDQALLTRYTNQFLLRQALPVPGTTVSMEQARCGQAGFVKGLIPSAGVIVGYKRDLRPKTAQSTELVPIRGSLLEKMILPNESVIDASFGAQPRIEADMVAVVRSAAIHDARTPREVLASLSAVHAFIELPDLAYQDPSRVDAAAATLVNANSRFGVLGPAIDVKVTQEMVEQLGNMNVQLENASGQVLAKGRGDSLAGNPLDAVIWLAEDLRKAGIRLRPGDLLSLGSFGTQLVPTPGQSYRLVLQGLPNTRDAVVHFR